MREMVRSLKSAPQVAAENIQKAIQQHITDLQSRLSMDEQLLVFAISGPELIVVENIAFPNWHTVILLGKDDKGNVTSVIASVHEIHLTCKVIKTQDKPYRIGFIMPDKK